MKEAQITLKLVLDVLGVNSDISTLEDRKRVQKAVYLGQASGVNLGYSYGWYLLGPYSPELTQDYFALNDNIKLGDQQYKGYVLNKSLATKLETIKDLMQTPPDVKLTQEDWLELVASTHYLMKEENKSKGEAEKQIRIDKPHLLDYFKSGYECLNKCGLI